MLTWASSCCASYRCARYWHRFRCDRYLHCVNNLLWHSASTYLSDHFCITKPLFPILHLHEGWLLLLLLLPCCVRLDSALRTVFFFFFSSPKAGAQTEMNPVNATALYVSASRAVLQCDPRRPQTFAEMYKQLPFFRQSLACLVCGKLQSLLFCATTSPICFETFEMHVFFSLCNHLLFFFEWKICGRAWVWSSFPDFSRLQLVSLATEADKTDDSSVVLALLNHVVPIHLFF